MIKRLAFAAVLLLLAVPAFSTSTRRLLQDPEAAQPEAVAAAADAGGSGAAAADAGGSDAPADAGDSVGTAAAGGSAPKGNAYGKYKPHTGKAAEKVPDEYLITLVEGADVDSATEDLTKNKGADQRGKWGILNFKGFGAKVPPGRADELLAAWNADPRVQSISDNTVVTAIATQTLATWGLDRVDQANLPLTGSYSYTTTGAGAWAYVIDTGIRATHTEFRTASTTTVSRVVPGRNTLSGSTLTADDNGHGTHCAGTIGGLTYGIAKAVTLVPVKALNSSGSGSASTITSAISYAVNDNRVPNRLKVISMSIGGSSSPSINNAVTNAVNAGVTTVVAAGNEQTDACTKSPAGARPAITVGATTSTDARASYSNFGTCVDIWAPGSSITSASRSGDTATAVLSGTSMATPHVAGMVARILGSGACTTPACVQSTLSSSATVGKVTGSLGSAPNLLLFRSGTL